LGTADSEFLLRAERDGSGVGRTYTISYIATDDSGQDTTGSTSVLVRHDHSGEADPRALHQHSIDARPEATAFFLTTAVISGNTESDLGQDSAGNTRPNDNPCP
jgi:hypothetical protein